VKTENLVDVATEKFYAALYDKNWWIGKVKELSTVGRDERTEFMHHYGPSYTYFWPSQKDLCWVPFENTIKEVPVSACTSISGRTCFIEENVQSSVIEAFKDFKSGPK
jgi:hypothetical protein